MLIPFVDTSATPRRGRRITRPASLIRGNGDKKRAVLTWRFDAAGKRTPTNHFLIVVHEPQFIADRIAT